jgi:ribosomal protein L7/L12
MGMRILFAIGLLIAFAFLVNWLNTRKVNKLRDEGIYPQAGLETDADVNRLILLGMKVEAIKVFRTVHGVTLRQAKEAVERRRMEMGASGKLG